LLKNGEIVDSEDGFYYCKLCVNERKTIKNRYMSANASTGMLFNHLKIHHGLIRENLESGNESSSSPVQLVKKPIPPKPIIQGLTFPCPEEECLREFNLKICLEIHRALEHTGIADKSPTQTDFHVSTTAAKDKKSMAWTYFGPLIDSTNNQIVDDSLNYCRLCVAAGNLDIKYLKSCSTTTLLHHVHDIHCGNKKKRKRFATSEISFEPIVEIKKDCSSSSSQIGF
jgi:hypothetical protein